MNRRKDDDLDQAKADIPSYTAKELIRCNPVLLSLWEMDRALEEIETAVSKVRDQMAPYVGPVPAIPDLKELDAIGTPLANLIHDTLPSIRSNLLALETVFGSSKYQLVSAHKCPFIPGYIEYKPFQVQVEGEASENDWVCEGCGRTIHGLDTCSSCGINAPWNRDRGDVK